MTTNNHNIVKPPMLRLDDSSPSKSNSNNPNTVDLSQLQEVISEMVKDQSQHMLRQLTQGTSSIKTEVDQTIDPKYLTNLNELDKIPDVVKSLREFSGQPGEFSSWRKSVERILKIYEHLKGTPKYYGILSVVRNKIVGYADTALESYNTPLDWERISKCLTLHYADKRDLGTLEYQMTTLIQRTNSIPEFYQQVYQHLSLILNKLGSMDMGQESMDVMTQAYRDKALDTFIRGLRGDLPRLLSMRGPTDLPEALHLCLKLENVQYRVQHSHGNNAVRNSQLTPAPLLPPRRNIPLPTQNNFPLVPTRNFYPELLHKPQAFQNTPKPFLNHYPQFPNHTRQFPQFSYQPQQVHNKNYLPKPEPMDVDQSIHSRRVNYQNRPQINKTTDKRPFSHQMPPPVKYQRIYHTEQSNEYPSLLHYQEQMTADDVQYDQTLLEYTNSHEIPDPDDYNEPNLTSEEPETLDQPDEVHFLD